MVRIRRALAAPPTIEKTDRPTGREGSMLDCKEIMTQLLKETCGQHGFNCKSLGVQQSSPEPVSEGVVKEVDVLNIMEDIVNQLADKLKTRLARVVKATLVKIMETVDTDRNKLSIREAFRRATGDAMMFMLEGDRVCEALKSTIIRVATSGPMVQAFTNMIVKEKELMAPGAILVVKQGKENVCEAA